MSPTFSSPGFAAPDTVLLVDDTDTMRTLYRRILEIGGFRVVDAASAEDALSLLSLERPNLILLDYMMPNMDGPAFARRLRAREEGGRIPVIFLSASASQEHMDQSFDAGGDDYISKPVDPRVLVARVKSTIAATRERASRERTNTVVAQRDHLTSEMLEGQRLQQAQLPAVPVRVGEWSVNGAVVPSGQVGGDLFDVIAGPDGSLTAFAVDVSGHGLAAAMVAGATRSALRLLLGERPMAEAVVALNQHLCERGGGHYACVAVLRIHGGEVTIVNAGLPPVCILEGGQTVARVSGAGTPPGLFPDATYEEVRVPVGPLSRVILMSDGLTEPFGRADDVEGSLARFGFRAGEANPDARALSERIARVLAGASEGPSDDATLLIVEPSAAVPQCILPGALASIDRALEWAAKTAPGWVDRDRLELGLSEVLTNAVIHGVMGIDSSSRKASLDTYLDAISVKEEAAGPEGAIALALQADDAHLELAVRWTGTPCPPEHRRTPAPPAPNALSGRGMSLIFASFDNIRWSHDGRGLSLGLRRA